MHLLLRPADVRRDVRLPPPQRPAKPQRQWTRRGRRLLVVAHYGLPPVWIGMTWVMYDDASLRSLLLLIPVYLVDWAVTREYLQATDRITDHMPAEQAAMLRLRAYQLAYRLTAAVLVGVVGYLVVALEFGRSGDISLWLPRQDYEQLLVGVALLLPVLDLPTSLLAWMAPDLGAAVRSHGTPPPPPAHGMRGIAPGTPTER